MKKSRVMLKLSGEALLGKQEFGIDPEIVSMIAEEIKYKTSQKIYIVFKRIIGALLAALIYPRLRKALGNEPPKEKVYVRARPVNPDELAEYEPADENEEKTEEEK